VPILPGPLERTLLDHPVHLRSLEPNSSRPPCRRTSTSSCAAGRPRAVRAESITAFVDLAGLGAGEYTLGVQVDASGDAGVARIIPATVQVTIARAKP
jgi:hypothetical protein